MRPDIESIKARADAATAGPWELVPEEDPCFLLKESVCESCVKGIKLITIEAQDNGSIIHRHWEASHCITVQDGPLIAGNYDYEVGGILRHVDTVFIANVRQDVPALLEYIAELEAKLDKFKLCEEHYGPIMPCGGEACYHVEDPDDD